MEPKIYLRLGGSLDGVGRVAASLWRCISGTDHLASVVPSVLDRHIFWWLAYSFNLSDFNNRLSRNAKLCYTNTYSLTQPYLKRLRLISFNESEFPHDLSPTNLSTNDVTGRSQLILNLEGPLKTFLGIPQVSPCLQFFCHPTAFL